jgi:hypothetical protein
MKVYLATSGSYSDYRVRGVFAREEDAEAYELADDVEEFDLKEGPQEVRSWHTLRWEPHRPEPDYVVNFSWSPPEGSRIPNPSEGDRPERRDYDGHPNRVEHRWVGYPGSGTYGALVVGGWEIERIRKVFGELRAEWLNNKSLGMVWDSTKFEWTPGEVDA